MWIQPCLVGFGLHSHMLFSWWASYFTDNRGLYVARCLTKKRHLERIDVVQISTQPAWWWCRASAELGCRATCAALYVDCISLLDCHSKLAELNGKAAKMLSISCDSVAMKLQSGEWCSKAVPRSHATCNQVRWGLGTRRWSSEPHRRQAIESQF